MSSQGNIADLEDSHPVESMDEETSAYSMSEAGDTIRRGKKRIRRNISVEQRDGRPLDVIRGVEKKLVEFLCRAENKVSKDALTFIMEQFGEVRAQAVEAIIRSERAADSSRRPGGPSSYVLERSVALDRR